MELLTIKEVSQILKTSDKTIRQYISNGELPAAKVGKSWRVDKEDLYQFINERKKILPSKEKFKQNPKREIKQEQEKPEQTSGELLKKLCEQHRQAATEMLTDEAPQKLLTLLQCVKCGEKIRYEGPCPNCAEPFKNILSCYYIDHDGTFKLKESPEKQARKS